MRTEAFVLKEDEAICSKCNGTGEFDGGVCPKCFGEGKLDWIDNVLGKEKQQVDWMELPRRKLKKYVGKMNEQIIGEFLCRGSAIKSKKVPIL